MKMLLLALFLTIASVDNAHAGLLSGGCSVASLDNLSTSHYASADQLELPELGSISAANYAIGGMSCETLMRFKDDAATIGIALLPVSMALRVPSVNAALAAEVAAVSATIAASPAILAVTVITAIGIGTTYIVVKASMDECRKTEPARLKAEFMRELEMTYGLKVKNGTSFEIKQ